MGPLPKQNKSSLHPQNTVSLISILILLSDQTASNKSSKSVPSHFGTKICCLYFISPMYAACPVKYNGDENVTCFLCEKY